MVTIFVPINTPDFIIEKIQNEGANVFVKGKVRYHPTKSYKIEEYILLFIN